MIYFNLGKGDCSEILMSCSKTEGEQHKVESTSPCSLRVCPQISKMHVKFEAYHSGQISRTSEEASFTERLGVCFSQLSVQGPGGGSLPRTISPIVAVP